MPDNRKTSQSELVTIYHRLDEDALRQLERIASHRTLEAGEHLLLQHTPARAAYVLESGKLMMERSSSLGRRQVIAFVHPGNFIGITHNEHYEFTVSALTSARVTVLPIDRFVALQDRFPQLKDNVRRISGNILSHALDQVFALGQKKAHERLCFLLRQLSEQLPHEHAGRVDLAMTREDIGDYLGLAIETVSRAFTKLRKDGVINVCSAHSVEILDPEKLAELALSD